MKLKIGILSLACMSGTTALFAAGPENQGIDFFNAGMYDYAKPALFKSLEDPKLDKAQAYYYLGEIYALENKKDSAAYCYKQGLVIDPNNVLNSIGDLKLTLKDNPAAEGSFDKLLSGKNKKNAEAIVAVANAYLPVSIEKAKEYLAKAKAVGPKDPDVYVLEGDIALAEKKVGEAANSYEQAIYFDPNCQEAYFKYAKLYMRANPQYSIDMLNKLLTVDPSFKIAYVPLANVYYENDRLKEAAEAYAKYIDPEHSSADDLSQYAAILYMGGNHEKAREIVEKAAVRFPGNAVMKRIDMYIAYDKGELDKSLELGEKFFAEIDSSRLIQRDYTCFARTLSKKNQAKRAITFFEQGIAADTSSVELLRELQQEYEKEGMFDKAIATYSDFIKRGGKEVKAQDYLNLGKIYYQAALAFRPASDSIRISTADSLQMVNNLKQADSMFAFIAEKIPDNYVGYFWRARTNSALDPESTAGLAKPYYEAALAILEQDKKNPKLLIECYSYLGYHYYVKEDFENSKIYWKKILELDPNHEASKKVLEAIDKP